MVENPGLFIINFSKDQISFTRGCKVSSKQRDEEKLLHTVNIPKF